MQMTIDEVKRAAKREDFRAGVQMRMLMPRLSVRVTRWVVAHTRLQPNTITLVSLTIGLTVLAGPVSTVTARAAEQLLDRNAYVRAVLGQGALRAGR